MPMKRENYPPNWEDISKYIRFIRAENQCECAGECGSHDGDCDAVNYENHPVTGSKVVLTVAHLDHDTTNNEYDLKNRHIGNLKAMCQRCHLNYDAEHHAKNRALSARQAEIDAGQLELI